ncbi:MAG: hypothetical protein J5631_06565 [Spirochaetaceae bacterium]|nr:hypothetical protein [Spirochaetaceae bacterium]
MKFLLFSNSAETQFRVRRIANPAEDSLVTIKDEALFLRLINSCGFDLFLIDLTSDCHFSDLRAKMRDCRLETPWIPLSTQTNLSYKSYVNYWNALNGIKLCKNGADCVLEKKLEALAFSLKRTNCLDISKNARKLLEVFSEFHNKPVAVEALQVKVFGEASEKNRNLLYGLIHEIRKAAGDDLERPRNLIRCKKGCYKLTGVFPESSLDICIYGRPLESEYARIFPSAGSAGYDEVAEFAEYKAQTEKEKSFTEFFAEIVEERKKYSDYWFSSVPNTQYLYEAVERLNGKKG